MGERAITSRSRARGVRASDYAGHVGDGNVLYYGDKPGSWSPVPRATRSAAAQATGRPP